MEMEERLLFNWVYVLADGAAVDQCIEDPATVLAHLADALATVNHNTAMAAQMTTYTSIC